MFRRYFDNFDNFDNFDDDFFVPFYGRRRGNPRKMIGSGNEGFLSLIPFQERSSLDEGFTVSNFEMKEDADNYKISLAIPDIKHKEVKVDFVKSENKLLILVSEKKEDKNQYYSSSYSRSMVLDKRVNANDIKADLNGDGVVIDIPKAESDVVNISIKGNGVTHLLDAVPDKGEEEGGKGKEEKGKAEAK
ncbi:uncharacterized protein KQ657_005113 [Scheffersomyces spartinae]|uniref:SHSP domain-containing protein n=1 Tax=Scheffersomyces spartinae TaxID=45513 RepID=A0A9P7VAN6_9ASCO|nr:uncharacterized protein KQ657_005113 [Scheffersomyces spartinae]KAG7193914.1 hypothetical protein KQ657_005113 [Scheffersomyces spartinae]